MCCVGVGGVGVGVDLDRRPASPSTVSAVSSDGPHLGVGASPQDPQQQPLSKKKTKQKTGDQKKKKKSKTTPKRKSDVSGAT